MKTTKLPKTQTGISIIEIMIALLIGLFLLGGLIQMFITSKQTYKVQDAMSRLQENGRFAMDFLVRDIREAGSWGCFSDTVVINSLLNTGTGTFDKEKIKVAIEGEENKSTNPDVLPDTDTLTLRTSTILLDANGADVSVIKDTPSALEVSGNSGIDKDDIVLVADCSAHDLFQVTAISSSNSSDSITYAAVPKNNQTPGNSSNKLSKAYGPDAKLYKANFVSYQIRKGNSGQPALFKINGMGNGSDTQELIEGVENMQILYGEDFGGSNFPQRYTTADNSVDMTKVVSIKISLLVRSLEDNLTGVPISYTFNGVTITPTDTRIRRVFSSVISVRNRLL